MTEIIDSVIDEIVDSVVSEYKHCSTCGLTKLKSEFHEDKAKKDGYKGKCKGCIAKYNASYRQDNKETLAKKKAIYIQDNKEVIAKRNAIWRQDNREEIAKDLDDNWSILTEAVQCVMKTENIDDAYEKVKNHSRGLETKFNRESYLSLVNSLDISPENKHRLLNLTPTNYF